MKHWHADGIGARLEKTDTCSKCGAIQLVIVEEGGANDGRRIGVCLGPEQIRWGATELLDIATIADRVTDGRDALVARILAEVRSRELRRKKA